MNAFFPSSRPRSLAVQPALNAKLDLSRGTLVVTADLAAAERMRRILVGLASERRVVRASTDAEARSLLLTGLPCGLALVDMCLPRGQSVPLIQHIHQACPDVETIAMSVADDQGMVNAAISSGAIGYLLTDADDVDLAYQLRSAERGGAPMDARITRRLLGAIAASAKAHVIEPIRTQEPAAPKAPRGGLSPRELKVLSLIAQGCSNRQIADAVYLSVNTIEFHTKNIYRKLCVNSRTQAVHEAMLYGLLN